MVNYYGLIMVQIFYSCFFLHLIFFKISLRCSFPWHKLAKSLVANIWFHRPLTWHVTTTSLILKRLELVRMIWMQNSRRLEAPNGFGIQHIKKRQNMNIKPRVKSPCMVHQVFFLITFINEINSCVLFQSISTCLFKQKLLF